MRVDRILSLFDTDEEFYNETLQIRSLLQRGLVLSQTTPGTRTVRLQRSRWNDKFRAHLTVRGSQSTLLIGLLSMYLILFFGLQLCWLAGIALAVLSGVQWVDRCSTGLFQNNVLSIIASTDSR